MPKKTAKLDPRIAALKKQLEEEAIKAEKERAQREAAGIVPLTAEQRRVANKEAKELEEEAAAAAARFEATKLIASQIVQSASRSAAAAEASEMLAKSALEASHSRMQQEMNVKKAVASQYKYASKFHKNNPYFNQGGPRNYNITKVKPYKRGGARKTRKSTRRKC